MSQSQKPPEPLQRFVITYTIGDSCTFSCEVTECVEYASKEQLEFDLELFMEAHTLQTRNMPRFCGLELDPAHFHYRDRIGNYHYDAPVIQTLDEWFESKKGTPDAEDVPGRS